MMRKGQTALEYLITYGWAILVILVVLAVLWYYGIFNPSRWAGEQVGSFTAFNVMDHKFTSTELQLRLANKLGQNIRITAVGVKKSGDTAYNLNTSTTLASPVDLNANSEATVTVPLNTSSLGASTGDIVSLDVSIIYDNLQSGLTGKVDTTTMNLKVA